MAEEEVQYSVPYGPLILGTPLYDGYKVDVTFTYNPIANPDGSYTVTDATGTYDTVGVNGVIDQDTITGVGQANTTGVGGGTDNELFIVGNPTTSPIVTGGGVSFIINNNGDSNSGNGAVDFLDSNGADAGTPPTDTPNYREGGTNTNSATNVTETPVCFASGTLIRTTRGDVKVEDLAVGSLAVTASGAARPIRWLGHRTFDCAAHPQPEMVRPIRVAAGAFGGGRPYRDLVLSPHHAVAVACVDEVLVPIRLLVNGTTIAPIAEADHVTYWHVELDSHDILLANGLPAESYVDVGNRCEFEGETALTLHPLFASDARVSYCRPLVTDGSMLAAIRAWLASETAPAEVPAAATFHLLVNGERIAPAVHHHHAAFVVPAGAKDVRLVSPTWSPIDSDPRCRDDRRLGLMIQTLSVDDLLGGVINVPLDDPSLVAGFHPLESGPDGIWRWTNGDALLSGSLFAGRAASCILRLTGSFEMPVTAENHEILAA